jgi:hypothetical protein
MLEAALTQGRPDAGRLVAIHAAAVRNLADGRQRLLDLAERERELVSGSWVRQTMQSHDGVVSQLAKAMPRSLAPSPSSAVRGIFLADFGSEFVECSGIGVFFRRG